MHAYLNGNMIDASAASIALEDAGVQHAVGLFETMLARHGRVFRLRQHVERLAESAAMLGLSRQIDVTALEQAVQRTLQHNELTDARVRLTVTAGNLSLLRAAPDVPPEPTVAVVAAPPTVYDPAYFERGITVLIAPPIANPFDPLAGHKTLSYWGRLRTLRQAAAAGAGEAVILQITNHLASGAISNLFLVRDGTLLTPIARGEEAQGAMPAPVLPGVTRAAVIELAEAEGIPVERRMLTVADLLDAEEVFLTNSSWLLLPVTKVEKKAIADGTVGPITGRLRDGMLDLIERETSPHTA